MTRLGDERGLIGKILVLWLVVLVVVVVGLVDGASILLARWRTGDLAAEAAAAAAEGLAERGTRREAVRAALATIARADEDASLLELEATRRGDVTVVVSDRAGTVLVGRLGFLEDLARVTASETASAPEG